MKTLQNLLKDDKIYKNLPYDVGRGFTQLLGLDSNLPASLVGCFLGGALFFPFPPFFIVNNQLNAV